MQSFLIISNSSVFLQEGKHPIYIYECLGEEERKGEDVNDYKLLETRSNVST